MHRSDHSQPDVHRYHVCGVPVDAVSEEELIAQFVCRTQPSAPRSYVCYVNAHVHNLARQNPQLRAILRQSALCYADGASVVWAGRLLGAGLECRLTGADFLAPLLTALARAGRRVFLLGGKPGVADRTAAKLASGIPGFHAAGSHHGYFSPAESHEVVQHIRSVAPDLLVVGMGTPRQEQWIADNLDHLDVPLVWAVGALLDYSAGEEKRCPRWLGDLGWEWLFRLAMNPRRMAKRYLFGNPKFVGAVLKARLVGEAAHA